MNPPAPLPTSGATAWECAGRPGRVNAMPLFNLAWKQNFFWDGRAPSLRAQALMPIQDHVEMDETLTNLAQKLANATVAQISTSAVSQVSKPADGARAGTR